MSHAINPDILEQQLQSIDKRLKAIEDKYPTVAPEYVAELAKVMTDAKLTKLTVGQITIEVTK